MLESVKQYAPEFEFDFLPSKRQAQDASVSAGKGIIVMGAAALGVFLSEKMQIPGSPENVVTAKIAQWTSSLGETGQRAVVVGTTTGAGAAAASQLDRLRPEQVVEVNGEEVPHSEAISKAQQDIDDAYDQLDRVQKEHEETTEALASAVGADPEESDPAEIMRKLSTSIKQQQKKIELLREANAEPPSEDELRTRGFQDPEMAIVLLETAESPEQLDQYLEGEERQEVLDHANSIRENAAVAA